MYYFQLIDSMNDWDITVDCSKEILLKAINGYDWVDQRSGDDPFASEYRISIETPSIDFIGNFALRYEGEIIKLPVSILENHSWGEIKLPSLEVWYVAYYLMGRKEKSQLILNYLQANQEMVDTALITDLIKRIGMNNEISEELGKLVL